MKSSYTKNTLKLTSLATLLLSGLLIQGCVQGPEKKPEPRAAATITPDADWSTRVTDGSHNFVCGQTNTGTQGKVLIGRKRSGGPSGPGYYLCATVSQFEPLTHLANIVMRVNSDGNFYCGSHQVLIGREFYRDDSKQESWYCANVIDTWGNTLEVIPVHQGYILPEHDHDFTCPAGSVLTGRRVWGAADNDFTQYRCGTLW